VGYLSGLDTVKECVEDPEVGAFVTSIMLNSFPKYKTRDLPGLKTYLERKGQLPKGLVLGLAGIITYYKVGFRGDVEIVPNDDVAIVELLKNLWATGDIRKLLKAFLQQSLSGERILIQFQVLPICFRQTLNLFKRRVCEQQYALFWNKDFSTRFARSK
jgi:mannitol-1-phosphate/altronate dehydrogenase